MSAGRGHGLPTGTVTFLRTDIEGSMELSRALGSRYDDLNAEHAGLVRAAVDAHGGHVVRTEGDAFFVVFSDAGAAARAAVELQLAMTGHSWPEGHPLRVRIGLHTGAATRAGDDYGGFEVSRAARIAAAGWGGQIVLSDATRALLVEDMWADWTIRDLGQHRLKGIPDPERLFQLGAPGLAGEFPALRSETGASGNLPTRLTTFIGREAELATLTTLLAGTRLLTLTGPGGTGKTKLALELARREAGGYGDGAWFVDLQSVDDVGAVRAEVAAGLGIFDGPAGSAADRLLGFVAERELLIVIDNFEQVIDAAGVVGDLLVSSSASRVIATSRIALRISGEQEYGVHPLGLAPVDGADTAEAVRLFVDRARRVRPELRAEGETLAAIERTCRLVDGLPLAIELCAARASVLPVAQIHDRLAKRLPLPGSGARDVPERQRTIEAAVAWSHDLLQPPERRLFARLGVFVDSFDLEQAEEVCGPTDELGIDVLEGLARLVEHSLLIRPEDVLGGVRFGMLETIGGYARARLTESGEEQLLRARHARVYAALVRRLIPGHAEPTDWTFIGRLEPEAGNVRQAADWAIESQAVELALTLAGDPWRFWVHSGRLAQGRELIDRALGLPGADVASEARAWAISACGSVAYWSGDIERANACYKEQLALAQALTLPLAEADAWFNLVFIRGFRGDAKGAQAAAAEASRILTGAGERWLLDQLEAALVITSGARVFADPDALLPGVVAELERLEASTSPIVQASLPALRAMVLMAGGDIVAAGAQMVQALRNGLKWRHHGDVIALLATISMVGLRRLPPVILATLLGAAQSAGQRYGVQAGASPEYMGLPPEVGDPVMVLPGLMGQEAFEVAVEHGRHMSLEQAVDFIEAAVAQMPSPTTES